MAKKPKSIAYLSGFACPQCHAELMLRDNIQVICTNVVCSYHATIKDVMSSLFDLYSKEK